MYSIWYEDGAMRHESYLDLHLAQQRWDTLHEQFLMLSRRP